MASFFPNGSGHYHRLEREKESLDERLLRLNLFIQSYTWKKVEHSEQLRLLRQQIAMTWYSDVLAERLAALPPPPASDERPLPTATTDLPPD